MVERRDIMLRALKASGLTCSICGSTHFYSPEFEIANPKAPSSDRRAAVRGKPDKPYEFIRVTCGACNTILFFDPHRFGPPSDL
jgi:RNase P subunit RPR2